MCKAKEPYFYTKRALCVRHRSPMCMAKKPYQLDSTCHSDGSGCVTRRSHLITWLRQGGCPTQTWSVSRSQPTCVCVCVCVCVYIFKRGLLRLAYLRYAYVSKETYSYDKRDLLYGKRDLLTLAYLRYAYVSKGTYPYDKRGLLTLQKRPINTSIPEVRTSVKRDLFI